MTFLTLDIETVPQAPFVEPSNYSFERLLPAGQEATPTEMVEQMTVGKLGLRLAEDFLLSHQGGIIEAIQSGGAQLEETNVVPALHATTCHVVQVSFGWRNTDGMLCRDVLQSDQYSSAGAGLELAAAAEYQLVTAALNRIASACQKGTTLASFNGKQFDIPTLRARAAILGVSVPSIPWRRILYPYSDKEHADLRLVLGADNRYARGTLQWWADTFGIHAEEHGRHVFGWVWRDKWDTLSTYGMTEAQTLVELYERVRGVL